MSAQTDPEIWRVVPSVPGYLASTHGRLMKAPYLAPLPNGGVRNYGGEPTYGVWVDSERRYITNIDGHSRKVARLVCEAFHGPAPDGFPVCMHLDEDSRNNRPENLQWGTQKENLAAPGYRAVLAQRRLSDRRQISDADVQDMRLRAARGETVASIAARYSLSAGYTSRIINGHAHKRVA
ncbi:HNH endonuclease signature motif containing protein [Phenylobacterium sp.]|uniref:HNH endonuclease signature motif containing protein n=1 Tax=Phenylobacterium sp. TaxID=1871053 RepID=UPI00262E318F|nr:HNH endonuclease signature motif containing protein [Phenylobacterium sp.]